MKTSLTKFAALLAAGLLTVLALPAHAVVYQVVTNATPYTALDGLIVTNLIQAGQTSLASVAYSGPSQSGFPESGLNDGSAAANANLTYFNAGNLPVSVTFNLNTNNGTGGATNGYDLTSVQCLSGWVNSYFADQNFQVLLSINGGPFNNYGSFVNTTTIGGGNNASMTTVLSSSGPIARNVTAIRYVFSPPVAVITGSSQMVIHELQAFGTPSPTNALPTVPYRICAVGDSITAGYTDPSAWTVPFQFGYRSGLMTRLATTSLPFQFVGYSPQPWSGTDGTVTNIPSPDLRIAGQNNFEGYSGKNTSYFLSNINGYMAVDQPDVVLLMASINDISTGSTAEPTGAEQNLSNIVQTVVSQSPNTRVIVAQITPYVTYTAAITLYNNYIANVLVPYFAGQGNYVTTVNQYTNMCTPGTTNIDATLFANANNHPNGTSYDRMAKTWFDGIQALSLPATPQPCAINANLVINGGFEVPRYTANSHNLLPQGGGWTFTYNSDGNCAAIDYGTSIYGTGQNPYDGNQRGCIQSGNSTVNHISQSISGFVVGQSYQLSFWAEGINGFSGGNPFHASIINGGSTNVLLCNGTNTIVPPSANYAYYSSAPFVASNTVMTLDFADNGLSVYTYVSWIDDVAIYAMPTPALVSTMQVGTSQNSLDGAIAVNLIRAGQQTLASVNASHIPASGWNTSALNDGSAAANANLTYYANVDGTGDGLPVVLTFNLNTNALTGGSAHGYNITNVQALSGWTDSYLANQTFELLLSINGGAYSYYGTYLSGTVTNSGQSSILETVSGNGGPIATNVTGVQYIFLNPGGPQAGAQGTVIRELQVFGSPVDTIVPAPQLVTNTLPATAANTVGDSVTFTAAFTNGAAINYQWQFISGGATNNIANATNTTLTLNNLQLTNSGSYLLEAINATNSTGTTYSTPSPLTVSSVPAAVNNVITELAAQTGFGPADVVGISFTPTWTVTTNNSLIAGQAPSNAIGNFTLEVPGRSVNSLTAGGNNSLSVVTATTGYTTSTNYVTCGNGGGAGSSITYTLSSSNHGYNLTNLTVYAGWADAGRDQQAYTVYYSTVAAPTTFISLVSVNYNPANAANLESATRATLVPASGTLATNVAAVKFDFTSPASENGYVGYNQITMFGSIYNHAPVAQALNLYTVVNQSVTLAVINGLNAPTDADGDPLAVTAVGTPANGMASTDGTNITYTPAGGFTGTDTFIYTVADGFGGTNTALATVVVYPWGVNPTSYGFGLVATGTVAQTTFTITNAGGTTLNGTASVGTAAYSIISGSLFSVVAGGTAAVTVQFAPSLATSYSDTVQFTSGAQVVNVPVTGTGMAPPAADFTGTPRVGLAPLPVTFTDNSYGNPTNWFWNFGDGTTTNASSGTAQHTYTSMGRWTVTLIASNPLGVSTNTKAAYIGTTPVVRILPVGDSITDGYSNPAYVPGGYRTLLASLMNAFNYNVVSTGLLNMNSPAGATVWHEGHDGANIAGVNYCMQGVFNSTADPDIILLLIGTNDYGQGIGANATNRLDLMISNLATNRPNAKIIVANLLLRTDNATIDSQITTTFNPFIPSIVAAHAALGQQVYFTDLRSAVTTAGLSPDGLHPNAFGYACMATNWFNTITNIMVGVYGSTNAPTISHMVSSGGLTNIVVTFSKPVSLTAATPANFTLSGGATVTAATLDAATERVVTLTTSPLTQNVSYTLGVSNVVDITDAQTPIAAGTMATFNACGARGATNNVAEASHFQLAYSLDIPNVPSYPSAATYTVDNHNSLGAFGRVAYYLELQATNGGALQYMWVSMNPFTTNLAQVGVPTLASGAVFQQYVTNMNVASSVVGIVTGTNMSGGNLEFWPYNYNPANSSSVTNASAAVYDWGDQDPGTGGYGSMQIANPNASQMLLSFNAWGGAVVTAADLGIGNNTVYQTGNAANIDALADIQLDWTFRANAASYAAKTLQVFIQPVPVPGTTNLVAALGGSTILATSNLVALAGNPANYPLTVTAVSATSTNGSTVSLGGGNITYTPNALGPDAFTYTLSDGDGGTAIGTVTVGNTNGLGGRVSGIIFTNGAVGMTFTGIPGYKYHLQVSTNLTAWNDVLITNVPAGGTFQFNSGVSPMPDGYYRLMWNGN